MATSAGTRLSVPAFIEDEKEHRRLLTFWAQQAHIGHLANVGTATLTANTTSTSVADARAGAAAFIQFMPTTTSAANEIGSGTLYMKNRGKQVFTIKHSNDTTTDRTFVYTLLG